MSAESLPAESRPVTAGSGLRRLLRRGIRFALRRSPIEWPRALFRRLPFSAWALPTSRLFAGRETVEFGGVTVVVDPGDKLGYYAYFLPDDVDWEARELIRRAAGARTIADIGANAGLVSLMVARHCPGSRVVAFEPEPGALAAFDVNLSHNRELSGRIEVVPQAVGRVDGKLGFVRPPSVNSGRGHVAEGGEGDLVVSATTLDSFFRDRAVPELIKIDVEGGELDVLEGGERTLRQTRVVLVELHGFLRPKGVEFNRLVANRLADLGFELYEADREGTKRLGKPPRLRPRMYLLAVRPGGIES